MTLQVGGHGDQVDPIAEAAARGATLAQFFLGDPQAWKGPEIRYAGGAAALKAAAAGRWHHALRACAVRAECGDHQQPDPDSRAGSSCSSTWTLRPRSVRRDVIVHGGHVLKNDDPAIGFDNWRKCIDGWTMPRAAAD